MMYPYMKFEDETEVTFSQIINKDGVDTARCELPSYKWIIREGYSEEEIKKFTEFLEHNAHLFFKYAKEGGIKMA